MKIDVRDPETDKLIAVEVSEEEARAAYDRAGPHTVPDLLTAPFGGRRESPWSEVQWPSTIFWYQAAARQKFQGR